MSAFKNDIRAIIHNVWTAGGMPEFQKDRKKMEASAVRTIMQKHRANYRIHFIKAKAKGR